MNILLSKVTAANCNLLFVALLHLVFLGCGGGSGADGVRIPSFQLLQAVDGIKREEGINLSDPSKDTTMVTADSMGAIGPNYVVQMVNFRIAIFDRRTTPMTRVREATLAEFFAVDRYPEGFAVGDPRVIYDSLSRRWFACGMDRPSVFKNNRILLAVSSDQDPVPLNSTSNLTDRTWISAKWKKYYLKGNEPELLSDYPCIGIDANGVYIATSLFDYYGSQPVTVRKLVAIPKAPLLAGTDILEQPAADANVFSIPPSEGGHIIQPAQSFERSPRGSIAWMLTKADATTNESRNPVYRPGNILAGKLRWNRNTGLFEKQLGWFENGLAVPAELSYWDVPVHRVTFAAPQKSRYGLTNGIPVGHTSTHITSAVYRNNAIWICQHVGFNADGTYSGSGTPPDRSGVVWFKLQVAGADESAALSHTDPPTFGRIWDANSSPKWFYYPSLAVNNFGDVLVGFSGSSENEFVSSYFQGWSGGFTESPKLIHAGRDFFSFGRWTDYSTTTLDPRDPRTFCTFQPYAELPPGGPFELEGLPRWGTSIALIKVVQPR